MRIAPSDINPLGDILRSIPEEGAIVNENSLANLALFLNSGGITCQTHEEVVLCLTQLAELNLIKFEQQNLQTILKVTSYGKSHLNTSQE